MTTTTIWNDRHRFVSKQEENTISLDGDKQQGFSPKALLLSGLAACSGIDVLDILGKQRIAFTEFRIDADAEQTETHPKVFKDIEITFYIKTSPQHEEKVRKAIELSLEKYCGVAAMLRKNSAISYKLVIE